MFCSLQRCKFCSDAKPVDVRLASDRSPPFIERSREQLVRQSFLGIWILVNEHSKRCPLTRVRVALVKLVKLFAGEPSVFLPLFFRQLNSKLSLTDGKFLQRNHRTNSGILRSFRVWVYELSTSREELTRRARLAPFLNVDRDAPTDITQHRAEHDFRGADVDQVEVAVVQNQRTTFPFVLAKFFGGFRSILFRIPT